MNGSDEETNEGDDLFLPAKVSEDFDLPATLKLPYRKVKHAVATSHQSTIEMYGEVFAFAILASRDENEDIIRQICERHDVTVRSKTSKLVRGLKIAISAPVWDEELNKIVLKSNDDTVAKYGRGFEYAFEVGRCQTKEEYVAFVTNPDKGGGTLSSLNALGYEYKKGAGGNDPLGPVPDPRRSHRLAMLRQNAKSEFGRFLRGKLPEGVSDGHYSITFSVVDGEAVPEYGETLDEDRFNDGIKKKLAGISKEVLPPTLVDTIKHIRSEAKNATFVNVTIKNAKVSIQGEKKDGSPFKVKPFPCDPELPAADFALTQPALNELRLGIRLLSEKKAGWTLEIGRKTNIVIQPFHDQSVYDLVDATNEGKDKKVAFDEAVVRISKGGKVLKIPCK